MTRQSHTLMHIDYFYGLSLFGLIVSCLSFAAVRWFHACRPYDRDVNYYYPARVSTALIYASYVIFLPFVADPLEPRAWLFTKVYFFVMLPFFAGRILIGYFGTVKHGYGWRVPGRIMMFLLISATAALWLWAVWPGLSPDVVCPRWLLYTIIGCGMASITYCLWVLRWVYLQLMAINEDNYSNIEDFPSQLARKALVMPFVQFLLFFPPIAADSPLWMAVAFLIDIVFSIYLLILVLHSHRHGTLIGDDMEKTAGSRDDSMNEPLSAEAVETAKYDDSDSGHNVLSDEVVVLIKQEITRFVEEDRQYLNPHLSIKEVAEHCHYGRTYISFVFKNELGGFFNYVNRLRLAHADRYRQVNRQASQEEVALASGFSSRQSYYSVRKRMEKIDKQNMSVVAE